MSDTASPFTFLSCATVTSTVGLSRSCLKMGPGTGTMLAAPPYLRESGDNEPTHFLNIYFVAPTTAHGLEFQLSYRPGDAVICVYVHRKDRSVVGVFPDHSPILVFETGILHWTGRLVHRRIPPGSAVPVLGLQACIPQPGSFMGTGY